MNQMEKLLEEVELEYSEGEITWQQYRDTVAAIIDDFNQD